MNNNQQAPAFPCVPIQDNFGRLIAAIPGMTKLEHFALQIYCANMITDINGAIDKAEEFLNALDKIQNKPNEQAEAKILSIDK